MNEEFKRSLTTNQKIEVCEDLRLLVTDVMRAKNEFDTLVEEYELPIGEFGDLKTVAANLLQDIGILISKIENDSRET